MSTAALLYAEKGLRDQEDIELIEWLKAAFVSATIFDKKEIEDGPMAESRVYKIVRKEGVPF